MDLGIAGRAAIVSASSSGLGFACAEALAQAGVEVTVNGRDQGRVAAAVRRIADGGGVVSGVVADLGTPEGRQALLEACPVPDILITNNGGPPPRPTREVNRADLLTAAEMNMFAGVELIQAMAPGMAERGFGRIVNITSVAVEFPLEGLAASSAARAGLTAFCNVLARQYASANVTINNLEPGFFATERVVSLGGCGAGNGTLQAMEDRFGVSVPAARLGDPDEFGRLCAFLCSAHAGYITGQRVLMDGGLVARV